MSQSRKHLSAEQGKTPVCGSADDSSDRQAWQSAKPFISPPAVNAQAASAVGSINVAQLAATTVPEQPLAILVVEDNRINRILTLRMLNHLGYAADSVNNGRECMEALAGRDYQLILMDLQMPIMDGLATAREIRSRNQARPGASDPYICAITANVLAKDRQECLAAGMDEFLPKPLRLEELKNMVTRVAKNLKNPQ